MYTWKTRVAVCGQKKAGVCQKKAGVRCNKVQLPNILQPRETIAQHSPRQKANNCPTFSKFSKGKIAKHLKTFITIYTLDIYFRKSSKAKSHKSQDFYLKPTDIFGQKQNFSNVI